MSEEASIEERIRVAHLAGEISGYFMFFGNGRPVVDEDFIECNSWQDWGRREPNGVSPAGWFSLNDGERNGHLTIPYWTDHDRASAARKEIIKQYKSADLQTPTISIVNMSV